MKHQLLDAGFSRVSKVIKPGTQFAQKMRNTVGHGTNPQAARSINRQGIKSSTGGYGKHNHAGGNGVYTFPVSGSQHMDATTSATAIGDYATNKGGNYGRGKVLGKKTGRAFFYQPSAPPSGKYLAERVYQPKALGKPVHQQNVHHDSVSRLERGNPAYNAYLKSQRRASTPVSEMSPGDRSRRLRQLRRKRGLDVESPSPVGARSFI